MVDQVSPWASGFNSTRDALNRAALDRELMAQASSPGLVDAGYQNPVPQDVGPQPGIPNADGSQGLQEAARADAPSTPQMVMAPPSAAQQAQARAQIYRKYGMDQDADKMLASQANTGLANAQTAETQQRTANEAIKGQGDQLGIEAKQRDADASVAQKRIRDRITSELSNLKDEDGNARDATQDEVLANQKKLATTLYAAGHVDASQGVLDTMKKSIADRVAADADDRKQAAGKVSLQVASGDYSGVADFIRKYSYEAGASDHGITDVQRDRRGNVIITIDGPNGPVQRPMPEQQFQQTAQKLLAMSAGDNAAVAGQAWQHVQAQIQQELAAAGASNASAQHSLAAAGNLSEQTGLTKAKADRENDLEDARAAAADALDVAEGDRTPAQQQAIKKYQTMMTLERMRGAGAIGNVQQNRTVNGTVNGMQTTIKTTTDGDFYLGPTSKTDKTPTWIPIKRSDQVVQTPAGAPAGAAPPATPTSQAQYNALPKGAVYTDPTGKQRIKG